MPDPLPLNRDASASAATNTAVPSAPASPERATISNASTPTDIVDAWVSEHPDTPDTQTTTAAGDAVAPIAAATTSDADATSTASATDSTATSTDAAPAAAVDATATTQAPVITPPDATATAAATDAQPAAATTTDVQPAAAAQPAQLDLSETIKLPAGELTRQQVHDLLLDRLAINKDLETFRKTFGVKDVAQLETTWKPLIAKLVEDRTRIKFIDEFLNNPDKAQYLRDCSAHYDAETGAAQPAQPTQPAAPAQPVVVQLAPEVQRQITELSAYKAQRDRQEAETRLNTEMNAAIAQFPILASDRSLMADVFAKADQLFRASNGQHGFPEAVASMSRYIAALQAAASTPAPAPAAAPPAVPALNGSAGASPTATRQTRTQPVTPGQEVDAWLNGGARAAGFE